MRTIKHLLVIRLSAMGDVAMTVPTLSAFAHTYPEIKITVLTRPFFKPLFSQVPNVSLYEADVKGRHKGIFGLWKLYKELKALHIDAVADLHNVLRSNILKCYFSLGRFSFVQIDKGRAEKKALIREKNKIFKQLRTTHQRYADVFLQLGFPLDISKKDLLSKQKLNKATLNLVGADTENFIGIAPFAAFQGKMYPLELMREVVNYLNNTNKYKILFFGGGKKEQEQLDIWQNQFSNSINIAGKLSFASELSLISNLDLMLAMDSGNAHLAAMFAIPTVTLWGVTHPYAGFYPFGQPIENAILSDRKEYGAIPTSIYGNKMPEGYENVMETIRPETVYTKIEELLTR